MQMECMVSQQIFKSETQPTKPSLKDWIVSDFDNHLKGNPIPVSTDIEMEVKLKTKF